MSAALIAYAIYGDIWHIYAHHLEDHWIEDPNSGAHSSSDCC